MKLTKPFVNLEPSTKSILKSIPDARIGQDALSQVSYAMNKIAALIAIEASNLAKTHNNARIMPKILYAAVRNCLDKELGKIAVETAMKINRFYETHTKKETRNELKTPPYKMEKILRSHFPNELSSVVPYQLAKIIDNLTAEILEVSFDKCLDAKKVTITPMFLQMGINDDEELKEIARLARFSIMGGGVSTKVAKKSPSKKQTKQSKRVDRHQLLYVV